MSCIIYHVDFVCVCPGIRFVFCKSFCGFGFECLQNGRRLFTFVCFFGAVAACLEVRGTFRANDFLYTEL